MSDKPVNASRYKHLLREFKANRERLQNSSRIINTLRADREIDLAGSKRAILDLSDAAALVVEALSTARAELAALSKEKDLAIIKYTGQVNDFDHIARVAMSRLEAARAQVAALTRALAESREALGYYKANGQWEWYMCRFENGEHSLKWHFTTPQAKGSFPSDVADKALTTPPQQER